MRRRPAGAGLRGAAASRTLGGLLAGRMLAGLLPAALMLAGLALAELCWASPAEAGCAPKAFDGASYVVCAFDPRRDELRLFWKGPDDRPFGSLGALAESCAAAASGSSSP